MAKIKITPSRASTAKKRTYPPVCYNKWGRERPNKGVCHKPCRRAYKPRPAASNGPWIEALRRYNKGGPTWCIPKGKTTEFAKVDRIMSKIIQERAQLAKDAAAPKQKATPTKIPKKVTVLTAEELRAKAKKAEAARRAAEAQFAKDAAAWAKANPAKPKKGKGGRKNW
jgi:hypothetical protein